MGKSKSNKYVSVNFGGVFALSRERKKSGKVVTQVRFPNSRPLARPLHDPRLTFRNRDLIRKKTKVGEIANQIGSATDGSALVMVDLYGENQMKFRRPRRVLVLPDGKKVEESLSLCESMDEIYDASNSQVTSLWPENTRDINGAIYSAIVPLPGGELSAVRKVPGKWELGGVEYKIRDGLRWKLRFKKFIVVRLVSKVLQVGGFAEFEKEIFLRPKDGPLQISFTSFSTWYSDGHLPSYPILERMIPDPSGTIAPGRQPGTRYPWPKDTSGASPSSVFCPNSRLEYP